MFLFYPWGLHHLFKLKENVDIVVNVSYKTIKIRDETYESINVLIADLIKELKRPVSMDEALRYLLKCRKNKPSTFAGGWKMDEKEYETVKKTKSLQLRI